MVFFPSPALRRIRQLVRLIRKHPDLRTETRNITQYRPQQSGPEFPRPELLDMMGNKTAARALAQKINVPVLPGTEEAARTHLAIPMSAVLDRAQADAVVAALR